MDELEESINLDLGVVADDESLLCLAEPVINGNRHLLARELDEFQHHERDLHSFETVIRELFAMTARTARVCSVLIPESCLPIYSLSFLKS